MDEFWKDSLHHNDRAPQIGMNHITIIIGSWLEENMATALTRGEELKILNICQRDPVRWVIQGIIFCGVRVHPPDTRA